jgi:hypothetical protein
MKRCRRCETEKPLESFGPLIAARDGKTSNCKECLNLVERQKRAGTYVNIKKVFPSNGVTKKCSKCLEEKDLNCFSAKAHGGGDGFRAWCKKCAVDYNLQYSKKNRHVQRGARLKREFNLSIEQYDEMLKNQDGHCAICGNGQGKRRLAVDHNHITGVVRGLLCSNCNVGIGSFKENTENLKRAIEYLGGA